MGDLNLDVFKQIRERHSETGCENLECTKGWILPAPLDVTDVRACQSHVECQVILTPAFPLSKYPNPFSEFNEIFCHIFSMNVFNWLYFVY